MKATVRWRGKFGFDSSARHHSFIQDATQAAGGADQGPTPKELVLAAICGCTGIDVVAVLKKDKERLQELLITAEAEATKEHPRVFTEVRLRFEVKADGLAPEALMDAVVKSQTLYCGVSAMIARACPIRYEVSLNGEGIGSGEAAFPEHQSGQ